MPWTAAAPCELLKLSDMADALHRGVLLILVRLGVAYGLCALFYALFGYEGFLGISFLAFVCAVTSANAALYMGIISPFGDKADKASFGIMLICSMPLLFLGFYGEAGFGEAQVMQIISLIIPFILGMVLGNMDMDIRKVFAGGNAIILPFLGFEFGSTINLIDAAKMLPQGLLMSIIYFIIVITPLYLRAHSAASSWLRLRGQWLAGRCGAGIPSMAAASNTAFEPYVTSAVAILAFVLAVTNILCPFMVKFILTRHPADEQSRQNTHKLADAKQ